jgi:hypothetical protein
MRKHVSRVVDHMAVIVSGALLPDGAGSGADAGSDVVEHRRARRKRREAN